MTQLEEYLERRKLLQERMKAYREISFDNSRDREERRQAGKKFNQYAEMLTELDEQIRAIDADALPASRRKQRLGNASLNQPISTGKELFSVVAAYAPDEETDNGAFSAWRSIVRHAALYLTPRQAMAMELRYNKGYSVRKVAELMGIGEKSASRMVKKAESDICLWTQLFMAAGGCTGTDDSFDFDRFQRLMPWAFPKALWEILMTLHHAAPEDFPTIASLAACMGANYSQLSRQLGWIKSLCTLYCIPLEACHPLIRNSRQTQRNPEGNMRQLNRFNRSNYGYYGESRAGQYAPRDPHCRHDTVEDAVLAVCTETYGMEDTAETRELIAEALHFFDDGRLEAARDRIDRKKTVTECGNGVLKKVRTVVEVAALYTFFRYDLRSIFAKGDLWGELLAKWQCFPPAVERTLRVLLDDPGIKSVSALAARLGISETNAKKSVLKAATYCAWWDVPTSDTPELVRRYLDAGADLEKSPYTFRRVVKRRETGRDGS